MENDPLNRALLSVATEQAKSEGITDEGEIAIRANELFQEILGNSDNMSVIALDVREKAKNIVAIGATQNIASPHAKPKFDYDKLRNETSIPAIAEILKKMGEHADNLPIRSTGTKEQEQASQDAYNALTLDIFKILNEKNVGMSEFKYVFDSLKAVISALDEFVMQQVVGHRHELASRYISAKNPGTGTFDANHATYKQLIDALEKVRLETGNDPKDYFTNQG